MKYSKLTLSLCVLAGLLLGNNTAFAGNEDRVGSAGATELLINPWARSSGWGNAGGAYVTGIESSFLNIAGLAFIDKTEIMFTQTNWLSDAGISISALGLAQKLGESGFIGLSVMSMGFGDIDITTTESPELGNNGVFTPRYTNIGLSYARVFSNSIYGGANIKLISESISNLKSTGVAFDAGIRYITGETENIKFGISLRNVGPPMRYNGDGLSVLSTVPITGQQLTTEYRSSKFEIPSLLSITGAYDFNFNEQNKLTVAGAFTANSFTKDQFSVGVEYVFSAKKAKFVFRGGYTYENGILNKELISTSLTGPAAGISIEVPFGSSGTTIALDYSYRASNPFGGSHSVGARINIK